MLVLLTIFASIVTSGCTAVGFGAGALIDMGRGKGPANRLEGVRRGVGVTIWLRDGRKLNGVFLGNQESIGGAATLAQASADSLAPVHPTVILLETREGVQRVRVDDVQRVSVPVASGKVTGAFIGLGLDFAALIFAAAMAFSTY